MSQKDFSAADQSLKYCVVAGQLDSRLLNGLCGENSKELVQRTTFHTVVWVPHLVRIEYMSPWRQNRLHWHDWQAISCRINTVRSCSPLYIPRRNRISHTPYQLNSDPKFEASLGWSSFIGTRPHPCLGYARRITISDSSEIFEWASQWLDMCESDHKSRA